MKTNTLHRVRLIHDVTAPDSDHLNGRWHSGYKRPNSERTVFYYRTKWWASDLAHDKVQGPYASREEALC